MTLGIVASSKAISRKKRWSRLRLIEELSREAQGSVGLSINIGSKDTRLGNINIDINGHPNIRGSVLYLPFRANTFSVAIFSEVLEHLPRGKERQALGEIHRVLSESGVLILSTPASEGPLGKLYWLGDPAFWLINHRHYLERELRYFLDASSFSVETLTRRGGPGDLLFSLVTPFAYLLRKLGTPWDPDFNSDYSIESPKKGYTFVVWARKSSAKNSVRFCDKTQKIISQ
jgi:SAM-dependent methyltransferase